MKTTLSVVKTLYLLGALALGFTTTASAQILPPPYTNTYSGGGSTNTNSWATIVAAQQADFSNNYAEFVLQDIVIPGGSQLTSDAIETQATSDLLTLSTNIGIAQVAGQVAVSNLLVGQPINIPQYFTDDAGNQYYFDHTNDDGSAAIKVTYNIESAQTVGAQKL